ncbi:Nramp family divalent metal transporter [Fodinibius sediminis]|uniref:NRAMP (Natural resistance-associated macrophage protein) metal ion transporters n=1 Tax=Fodinibius sediminis TaxID=1214077 RepID=A0A521E2E2_9BACT|nr:Nramp family divalent metal transporter [Fodinibius sediminis]SMO77280.1 NRAMP (natural resistance-associated macrophage protein) metal ion transporters [Fodinibius sediminis]
MKELLANFFDRYGLSFIMVASYFGSGSIFIASQAGVEYGYVLIWAVIGAVLLGFMAQDMSARLGIFGDTLMTFIREKLGKKGALVLALFLSIGCIAWTLALTAAVGKSVELLTAGSLPWQPIAVVTGVCAILVGIMNYDHVEKVMTGMMFLLLILYLVVAGASQPSVSSVITGFIPSLPNTGAMLLGAAILGTTALWPNFFLESILVKQKGWNKPKHVKMMRSDLAMGYSVGGLITLAIIIVAAAVLRPAGYTELSSFMAPGEALEIVLGQWAMIVFLLGVIAAAFNSIVPIMWTIPFMILEALDIDHKEGSSSTFKLIFAGSILLGMFSPLVAHITGLSVVEMVTLFPAYNGVFGLPITAALLFWAVNDRKLMGINTNSWKLNVVNIVLVLFSIYIAINSGRGVLEAIFGGLLT